MACGIGPEQQSLFDVPDEEKVEEEAEEVEEEEEEDTCSIIRPFQFSAIPRHK